MSVSSFVYALIFPLFEQLASSTGRNTSSAQWSDRHRVPNQEDFPSLPGANYAPAPTPSHMNGAIRKTANSYSKPKPKTQEEDFPSLGGPSKGFSASFAARSSMSRINSAPIYKAPSWQQQQEGSSKSRKVAPAPDLNDPFDIPIGETKPRPASAALPPALGTMTQLTKKSNNSSGKVKISSEEDFPGLAPEPAKATNNSNEGGGGGGKKKNKKKKKQNGLDDDDERSSFLKGLDAQTASSSGLQSAADLIFGVPSSKENDDPMSKDDTSWSKVEQQTVKKKNPEVKTKSTNGVGSSAPIPGLKFEVMARVQSVRQIK